MPYQVSTFCFLFVSLSIPRDQTAAKYNSFFNVNKKKKNQQQNYNNADEENGRK